VFKLSKERMAAEPSGERVGEYGDLELEAYWSNGGDVASKESVLAIGRNMLSERWGGSGRETYVNCDWGEHDSGGLREGRGRSGSCGVEPPVDCRRGGEERRRGGV
jgi:hypothetical protein